MKLVIVGIGIPVFTLIRVKMMVYFEKTKKKRVKRAI